MISEPRRSASSTIARPAWRARTTRSTTRTPYGAAIARRLVEQTVGLGELGREVGVERQLERHDDHAEQDDSPGALRREAHGDLDCLVRLAGR